MSSFGEDESGYGCEGYEAQRENERDPWAFDHERTGYGPGNHACCEVGSVHLKEEGGSLGDGNDVGYEGVEHGCDDAAASPNSGVLDAVRRGCPFVGQYLGSKLTAGIKR